MPDFSDWANRRGRGPRNPHPAATAPTGQLPPPPDGYAWFMTANGPVCMQMAPATPSTPVYAPAPRQPVYSQPYAQPAPYQPIYGTPPKRVESCMLVTPDSRDVYAEFLGGVPDLVPPSPYDAMAGNPDPRVMDELGAIADYNYQGMVAQVAPTAARPRMGRGAPAAVIPDLRPVPEVAHPPGKPPGA